MEALSLTNYRYWGTKKPDGVVELPLYCSKIYRLNSGFNSVAGYKSCVQSVMVYASETWAVRVEQEQRMERNENVMLRLMCGVTLRDKVPTVELRRRLGIEV